MLSDEHPKAIFSVAGLEHPIELCLRPPDGTVMVDAFEGPKLKFQRAQKHMAECGAANRHWAENYHDPGVQELDSETGRLWSHFTMPAVVDPTIRLAAADALYNFRSALDQAVSICVGLTDKSTNHVYFPHGKDANGFEKAVERGCSKVPECVVQYIREMEPWRGGKGEPLRSLHDLNIGDKHNDLIKPSFQISHAQMITELDPRAVHPKPHAGLFVALAFAGEGGISSMTLREAFEVIEHQVYQTLSGIVVQMSAYLETEKRK